MDENQPTPPDSGAQPPRRAGLTPEQQAKIEAARAAKAAAGGGAVSGGGKPKPTLSPERAAELAARNKIRDAQDAQDTPGAREVPAGGATIVETPAEPAMPSNPKEVFVYNLARQLDIVFGEAVHYPSPAEAENKGKEPFLIVNGERLPEIFYYLRDTPELGFDYLSSITAIDFKTHFDVVYQLLSLRRGMRELYIRTTVPDRDNAVLPTVYDVYHGADFQEREVYDLMGITFRGHPYLRRILTWDTFVGHPLRKDWIPPTDWRIAPE